jgi:hypothetical protein
MIEESPAPPLIRGCMTTMNRPHRLSFATALVVLVQLAGCGEAPSPDTAQTASTDSARPWLYLIDAGGETSRLLRVRTDGSGMETVLDTVAAASRGLVLHHGSNTLIWASRDGDRIQRARLSDSAPLLTEELPIQGLDSAYAVVLDQRQGHLYWSDYGTGSIHRANVDGSSPQVIVKGLIAPRGMDLDTAGGWLYWTDVGSKKVQRAKLDGTGLEDLLGAQHGLDQPYGVTLDMGSGSMFITDAGTGRIMRSKQDGADLTVVIPESGPHPSFLIISSEDGRMYWGDNRANRVRRARLDGTEIEDVIAGGLAGPRGLALVRQ